MTASTSAASITISMTASIPPTILARALPGSVLRAAALCALLSCVPGHPPALAQTTTPHTAAQPPARPVRPADGVQLNFTDARIDAVATSIGALAGKNVVVDPKVQGTITLVSEQHLSPRQALVQLQNALRMHGYAVVDTGTVLKVVPEADAKLHATRVNPSGADADVVTQVFTLHHENAAHVLNIVRPLISANNVVNISPGTNALVVTDYADNIARIARLIAALDRPASGNMDIIALEHAIAAEMVPLLQRLLHAEAANSANGTPPLPGALQTTLLADNRSNALIVRAATPARLADIRALVARLDQPAVHNASSTGNLHVVHLRHADAVALAETLRAAIRTIEQTASVPTSGGMGGTPTSGSAPTQGRGIQAEGGDSAGLGQSGNITLGEVHMPSTGGLVQADPDTNSLIITAPAPLYRQLRAVIDRLDTRRAQVLVESMIVEVSDNKLAEFGVQWQTALGQRGDSVVGALGTNSNIAGGNILNIAAAIASADPLQAGTALGSLGGGLNLALAPRVLGQHYLGALAHFLQRDGSSNILSKPNLMTLDNQEARIIIGNNVPFVTGSYAATGNSASVNPFTTVERHDVGLMLYIRPTINENGTIKLTISQEVSHLDPATLANANGPTTSKRAIDSTVLVDDGAIVMLGGLLEDSYSLTMDKVPLLGDIPVMGHLFKSENRKRNKTNLMVFLRPTVLRDATSTHDMAMQRYQEIRALQEHTQPANTLLLRNVPAAPILPTLPGSTPAVPTPAADTPVHTPSTGPGTAPDGPAHPTLLPSIHDWPTRPLS